jgi:SAM-dependent methyltransferase
MFQNFAKRVRNKARGLLLAHGNQRIKRSLWNAEFARGRWNDLARTVGDCIYPCLEQYGNDGSILDLGCGSGNTGTELDADTYHDYTGVDISDVAIDKAKQRTEECGRIGKNDFVQSDIFTYEPAKQFDVILFRESIYYVPGPEMKGMLDRYAEFLKPAGVFIVRLFSANGKCRGIVDFIEADFEIVEKRISGPSESVVLVFRQASVRREAVSQ